MSASAGGHLSIGQNRLILGNVSCVSLLVIPIIQFIISERLSVHFETLQSFIRRSGY